MLYEEGTANTLNGLQIVTGSGTQWVDNARVGGLISFDNDGVWYQIARVLSRTELRVSVPIAGTHSNVPYKIIADFTPSYGFPHPGRYDVDKSSIVSRAFIEMDTKLAALHARLDTVQFPVLAVPDMSATPSIQGVAIISDNALFAQSLTVETRIDYVTINAIEITLTPASATSTPSIPNLFIGTSVKASDNVYLASSDRVVASGALLPP